MSDKTRSASIFMDLIKEMSPEDLKNPKKLEEKKDKAIKTADEAYKKDKGFYRIAISTLCLLTLIAAIGSIILVSIDKTTPEALVAIGSAAVGGLVGLFAPSPVSK